MQGTMLWFNDDKGYGYISTEEEERLYVARADFAGEVPVSRCKGRAVSFDRSEAGGSPHAVNVVFLVADDPRRARLRAARGGSRH